MTEQPPLPYEFLPPVDRKSTRLNSSHDQISYAVFCLKKKKTASTRIRMRGERCSCAANESKPLAPRRNWPHRPTPSRFPFPFFFNDTATTEIYTLSLHDALPIYPASVPPAGPGPAGRSQSPPGRSEEHTSELQSRSDIVCRRLLEQKKTSGS